MAATKAKEAAKAAEKEPAFQLLWLRVVALPDPPPQRGSEVIVPRRGRFRFMQGQGVRAQTDTPTPEAASPCVTPCVTPPRG